MDELSVMTMKRYTRKSDTEYSIDNTEIRVNDSIVTGNAIDQLAEYENFYQDLLSEKSDIINQLDQLRQSDNTKSATFRQLFANKINIEMIIERVERYKGKQNKS